jgi:putative transposase
MCSLNIVPAKYKRRSMRLKSYDYTQAGAYFVTICTQKRHCLFGDIVETEMRLNNAGQMVWTVWDELSVHYSNIELDGFVIMPNHVHAIVILVGVGPRAYPDRGQPQGLPLHCRCPTLCIGSKRLPLNDTQMASSNPVGCPFLVDCGSAIISST